jgi:hypothetical protein
MKPKPKRSSASQKRPARKPAGVGAARKPAPLTTPVRAMKRPRMDQATVESIRKITHTTLAELTPREAKSLRRHFKVDWGASAHREEIE